MGQGEGANQPTKGLCAPPNPSHITRRGGGATPRASFLGGGGAQTHLGFPLWPPPLPWHSPSLLQHLLLLRSAWRSPAGTLQAPPPCRRAAGALTQLLLSPCWIKKEETSPGCQCVERGGAVRSTLDRIFCDLNRREYDSINRVLVTLPLSDIQGYEDALPPSLSCC